MLCEPRQHVPLWLDLSLHFSGQRGPTPGWCHPGTVARRMFFRGCSMHAFQHDSFKRVLLVVQANETGGIGGMETLCVDLGLELHQRGIEIMAIVPEESWADPLVDRFHSYGARVLRLDTDPFYGRLSKLHGRLMQAQRQARLWRLLLRWRPDLVHVHVPCAPAGLAVIAMARLAGIPVIIEEHNVPWPDPSRATRLAAWATNHLAQTVLSVSRYNAGIRTS